MDDLTYLVLSGLVNGLVLFLGLYFGTRRSADVMEKKIKKIMDESKSLQVLSRVLAKVDESLGKEDFIGKVSSFFDEATKLVKSEEARNFFKNLTLLMKQFTAAPEKAEPLLKLPQKPEKVD